MTLHGIAYTLHCTYKGKRFERLAFRPFCLLRDLHHTDHTDHTDQTNRDRYAATVRISNHLDRSDRSYQYSIQAQLILQVTPPRLNRTHNGATSCDTL